jgi:hypothetical protein
MNRYALYRDLVERRKAHVFPEGLLNPCKISGGKLDGWHLGPWSRWQGSLEAEVVVVGQDWGNEGYFLRNGGIDDDTEQTCSNLREMALCAGWDLGTPNMPNPQPLFFSNAVLGIRKETGKSGTPPDAWVDDSVPFLVGLLEIIQPRAIVSLGTSAYRACRLAMRGRASDDQIRLGAPLSQVHRLMPILRPRMPAWFAFYHCGPLGMANRSRDLQRQDWCGLGEWLRHNP